MGSYDNSKYELCGLYNKCNTDLQYCEPVQHECVSCKHTCDSTAKSYQDQCQKMCTRYLKIQKELAETTTQAIVNTTESLGIRTGESTQAESVWAEVGIPLTISIFAVIIVVFITGGAVILYRYCRNRKPIPPRSQRKAVPPADPNDVEVGDDAQVGPDAEVQGEASTVSTCMEVQGEGAPLLKAPAEGAEGPDAHQEKLQNKAAEKCLTEGGRVLTSPTDRSGHDNNGSTALADAARAPGHHAAAPPTPQQNARPASSATIDLADLPQGQPGRVRSWVHNSPSIVSSLKEADPAESYMPASEQQPSFHPDSPLDLQSFATGTTIDFNDSVSRPASIHRGPERERPSGSG